MPDILVYVALKSAVVTCRQVFEVEGLGKDLYKQISTKECIKDMHIKRKKDSAN